jgi:DNA-directed RNA polymerase specialized sigma subunit
MKWAGGSWIDFVSIMGPSGKLPPWSDTALLGRVINPPEAVLDVTDPEQWIKAGYRDLVIAGLDRFNTWQALMEEANTHRTTLHKEAQAAREAAAAQLANKDREERQRLMDLYREHAANIENPRSVEQWAKHGYKNFLARVRQVWGGWKEFLIDCGIQPLGAERWVEKYTDWERVYVLAPALRPATGAGLPVKPPALGAQEEVLLVKEVQKGNGAAREALVFAHLPQVDAILGIFLRRRPYLANARDDLRQMAIVGAFEEGVGGGLTRGVECLNPSRATRASTYLAERIEGALLDAAEIMAKEWGRFVPVDESAMKNVAHPAALPEEIEDSRLMEKIKAVDNRLRLYGFSGRNRDIFVALLQGEKAQKLMAHYDVSESRISQLKKEALSALQAPRRHTTPRRSQRLRNRSA